MPDVPLRRPRIADVARQAGVSKAAVSFAFNSPERLSPATANRIMTVATSLGYRPHPVARMLTAGQTATVGILSPQPLSQVFGNPFFPLFAEGVAHVAEERGFGLLFISPLHGSLAGAMARATVDGVVVVGLDRNHPEMASIRDAGLTVVVVDAPTWPEYPSVDVDDEGGAAAAADHLLGLGHREILLVGIEPPTWGGGYPAESVMGRRLRGYRAAFERASAPFRSDWLVAGPATLEGGEVVFARAWEDGLRPTAVLAMSDAMAAGTLQAARTIGLEVPEHLSIVGFDDLPLTRFTDPPLTTVHQPVRRKGEEAATLLLEALGSRLGQGGQHRVLETRLVVRRSTAAVRGVRGQEVVHGD